MTIKRGGIKLTQVKIISLVRSGARKLSWPQEPTRLLQRSWEARSSLSPGTGCRISYHGPT